MLACTRARLRIERNRNRKSETGQRAHHNVPRERDERAAIGRGKLRGLAHALVVVFDELIERGVAPVVEIRARAPDEGQRRRSKCRGSIAVSPRADVVRLAIAAIGFEVMAPAASHLARRE